MMASKCRFVAVAISSLCIFVVIVWGSAPCAKEYCEKVDCGKFNATDCDHVLEAATICGCCDTCVTFLEEKEKCQPISANEIGAVGKKQHCGPQLECFNRECRKRQTPCLQALVNYAADDGWLHIGDPKPQCDDDGTYFRKQCRPGSMCYCVDRDGNRIFGETSDKVPLKVGCACSRDFNELQRVVEGTSLGKWMEDPSGRLDHFLRCMDTGDYDSLQCVDDKCFCLNETMQVKAEVNSLRGFRNLSCYNPNYHDETFYRPCEREWKWKVAQKKYQESQGRTVIGMDFPVCDLDGTYSAKQCRLNECFCADREGNRIGEYIVPRYNTEMKECQCAREQLFLKKYSLTKKVTCNVYGNYEPMQCLGAYCYCVDTVTGDQNSPEFDPLVDHHPC